MHVTTQGANDLLDAFVEQMRNRIGTIDDVITRQHDQCQRALRINYTASAALETELARGIEHLTVICEQLEAQIAEKDDMINRADLEIEQLRGAIDDMTTRLAEAEAKAGEKIAASIAESIAAFLTAK